MSVELKALSTATDVSVDKLHQLPLKIFAQGETVYTYPQGYQVSNNGGKLTITVTAGTLWQEGSEDVLHPGALLKFQNELTKSTGVMEQVQYEVVYAVRVDSADNLNGGSVDSNIRFYQDYRTGTLVANMPCYALVRTLPKRVRYDKWRYDPPLFSSFSSSGDEGGTQLEAAIPMTNTATIIMIHYTNDFPKTPPQLITEEIQMPVKKSYEAYTVNVETILTRDGEFVKPADWDTDSYDPKKAYKDDKGAYTEGPSKDDSWVAQKHVVERGQVTPDAKLIKTTSALPANIKGVALKEYTNPKDTKGEAIKVLDTTGTPKVVVDTGVHPYLGLNEKQVTALKDEITGSYMQQKPAKEGTSFSIQEGKHYMDSEKDPNASSTA